MVILQNLPSARKLRESFSAGYMLIQLQHYFRDIHRFLTKDTGTALLFRKYPVNEGILRITIGQNDERKCWRIFGLNGLKEIYVMFSQERGENGEMMKVLYGWKGKNDWGKVDTAHIRYCLLTRKRGGAEFKPEKIPIPLLRLKGDLKSEPKRLAQDVVTQGLNGRTIFQDWEMTRINQMAYIEFNYQNKIYVIDGLNGCSRVTSALSREGDQIVLRIYKNKEEAIKKTGLIKGVIVAERVRGNNGKDPAFVPLEQPRTIFSIVNHKLQPWRSRLFINEVRSYLLSDKKEGDYLDLEPRTVYKDGTVRFGADTGNSGGGIIILPGYKGFKSVYGRIITKGDKKIAYSWPDAQARAKGASPIIPNGQVVAERSGEGKWNIIYRVSSEQTRQKRKLAYQLGNFLYATVGDKVFASDCPIYTIRSDGRSRKALRITLRGIKIDLDMTSFGLKDKVYLICRELGGRFKLLEFWADKRSYEQGAKPLTASFVAFKPENRPWEAFKARFEVAEADRFRKLFNGRKISRAELSAIMSREDLLKKYGEKLYDLIDTLFLAHKKHDQPVASVE